MISNDRKPEFPVNPASVEGYLQRYQLSAYGSGREALIALFTSKSLEGSTVMLPGFLPQGIFAPLNHFYCNLVFYRTDSFGNPDLEHISELFEEHMPDVFFLLHYFGVKRKSDRLVEILKKFQPLVLEDFAQSFPDEEYIEGSLENLFLVSLPKLFGIPDGGLIYGSDQQLLFGKSRRTIGGRTYTALRQLSLRFARPEASGFSDRYAKDISAVFSILSYRVLMKSFTRPSAQSRYSNNKFRRTDVRAALAKRAEYAREYCQGLKNDQVTIQPGINPSIDVLMGFPVYVENRIDFYNYLTGKGIKPLVFSGGWGYLPTHLEPDFPETLAFRDNHLLLPLCHHLCKASVNKVIDVVNDYPG